MEALLARLKRIRWIKFTFDVFGRFGKDNGGLMAAGLTFFQVLAFVPMLLVGIAALGYYFHAIHSKGDPVQEIQKLLTTQVLPGAAGNEVKHLMERANIGATVAKVTATRGVAGIIGLLGLVWASLQIFVNGSVPMNLALDATETRSWIKLRLIALGLLVGTGVLLVLSIAATAFGTVLSRKIPGGAFLYTILSELGAVVFGSLMFAATYKFLPSARVSWRAAIIGGLAAGLAWEIAKKGLAVYLLHPNTSLYGNLANLIIFILWVYYSMMIFLLGAEVTGVYATDIEGSRNARLKKSASLTPSADAAVSSGSPLTRSKERNRAERIRKAGKKPGEQTRR